MTDDERGQMADLIATILDRADRLECEKNGKALTADEVRTVRAASVLRMIAPYVFTKRETR